MTHLELFSFADIDECKTKTHNCDSTRTECHNTDGDFECVCKEGYVGEGQNKCVRSMYNYID